MFMRNNLDIPFKNNTNINHLVMRCFLIIVNHPSLHNYVLPWVQLCNGVDETAMGTSAELIFAPMDASFSDDAPLLPSGFRIIPLGSGSVSFSLSCLVYYEFF